VEGTDLALWVQTPQLGAGWHSLGGRIIAPPAIAAIPQPGGVATPLFIAVGTDRQLWVRDLTSDWSLLGPSRCWDAPSAVVASGELTVACEGPNNDDSLWTATVPLPSVGLPSVPPGDWTSLGGTLAFGPAVTYYNGQLVYFATAPSTTSFSGQVYFKVEGSAWVPFQALCFAHLAAGETNNGQIAWFGCNAGQMWAGGGPEFPAALSAQGGSFQGGPGLAIDSGGVFFLVDGTDHAVWIEEAGTNTWTSLGGQVASLGMMIGLGGVGAVGLN
jgi:hypothetical protein